MDPSMYEKVTKSNVKRNRFRWSCFFIVVLVVVCLLISAFSAMLFLELRETMSELSVSKNAHQSVESKFLNSSKQCQQLIEEKTSLYDELNRHIAFSLMSEWIDRSVNEIIDGTEFYIIEDPLSIPEMPLLIFVSNGYHEGARNITLSGLLEDGETSYFLGVILYDNNTDVRVMFTYKNCDEVIFESIKDFSMLSFESNSFEKFIERKEGFDYVEDYGNYVSDSDMKMYFEMCTELVDDFLRVFVTDMEKNIRTYEENHDARFIIKALGMSDYLK